MWGALIFLALFLVIDPTTRDLIVSGLEQARLQLAVEAPLSYFLAIVLLGSAIVSALIMAWWPRVAEESKHQIVVRRYQGLAQDDPAPAVHPEPHHLWTMVFPSLWLKRLRVFAGFGGLKRSLRA